MNKVRWGVIGCGQIAFDKAMPAMTKADHAELVAAADVRPERLELVRNRHGDKVRTYMDHKALLASGDVDAVYLGLPNEIHHPFTIEAAQSGKHVLCEKPLSIDAAEAREMIAACQENQVKLMTAYMSRFGDSFREARRILMEERLGKIAMVNASFSFAAYRGYTLDKVGAWRWTGKRGGPLLDAGIYLAFALRELIGSRVARVAADMRYVIAKEFPAPDTVVAWLAFEDGTPGILSTAYSHGDSTFTIHGTEGYLILKNCFAQNPGGSLECRAGSYRLDFETDLSRVDHFENYRREIEHFSKAILQGDAHRPSAQESLEDMLFLDAIEEAAKTGRVITIEYQ
jgi:predicted dehydrogenase